MKKVAFAVLAAVILVMPLVAYAQGPNPGTGNTTIFVMNLDNSGPATVTAEFIDQTGATTYSDTDSVPYAGFKKWRTQDIGNLTPGWLGSLILSSDKQIAAVAHIHWTGGVTAGGRDGITGASYTGFAQGALQVEVPSIFKRTYQSSRLSVQNTGSAPAQVEIDFFTRGEATPVYTHSDTIPVGAERTYDVWDFSQIPTDMPTGGSNNWKGSARVRATGANPQPVAVVVTTFWNYGSSAYAGLPSPATTLYAPSLFMKNFGNWQIYSGLIIANPNASDAHVTFNFYNRDGTQAVAPANVTIGANSSDGFNTRYDADPNGPNPNGIFRPLYDSYPPNQKNWNGLAIITSDQPVVGIVNTIWRRPSERTATYAMLTPNDAGQTLYYPIVTKEYTGSWAQWTGSIFMNPGGSTAHTTATFYNSDGTPTGIAPTQDIPSHGAKGWNTRYDADPGEPLQGLPSTWEGTMVVTSDVDIVGIANNLWADRTVAYEAQKAQ
ncbi:MAG TPA: hypothetical protein EYP04_07070 [Anaerolineae bacterium]|nr:hypothetical protein [Anaerolineae bacterium]HIQ04943.1 hypothetical protein [Anaerolineae bacterium]